MTTQLPTKQGGEMDDGGPAFPFPVMHGKGAPNGMSLRDYFAAKVLCGMATHLSMEDIANLGEGYKSGIGNAHAAYVLADAMIAARNAS